MSLLNRPGDGIHSVLIVIFKLLSPKKKVDRKRILALCAPGEMPDKMARQTLNTWIDLGLFTEDEGGVCIHSNIKPADRKLENLPRLCRKLVMSNRNNENFWESEENRASDFTRALCWMLAQDSWNVDFGGWDGAETLMVQQCPSEKIVQNDTRWSGLKAWLVFLGFGWNARYPSSPVIADPSDAIRDELANIFGKKREMVASDLISSLAANLPVLDGGEYRLNVEDKLRDNSGAQAWQPVKNNMISTSLSRSLLRLEESGVIHGRLEDDFDVSRRVILSGKEGSVLKTYSHYRWNK